jgi:PAS domain S-box-containing protein
MSLIHFLAFVLIAASLVFASIAERKNIDLIVENSLRTTIQNARNSRDFGLLNARLRVFESTFYVDDKRLENEGEEIRQNIEKIRHDVVGANLKTFLTQLEEQFSLYHDRREWINYLLFWRSEQDQVIDNQFQFLQEIIAEKKIQLTLEGESTDYLDQLVLLISGYRESLFEIAKLNAEENPAKLLSAPLDAPIPLKAQLDNLILRLGTLTASEPPIDRLGKHLLDRFAYYQYLMEQYRHEMFRLGELTRILDSQTKKILAAMAQLDKQTEARVLQARAEIRTTSNIAAVVVIGLLGLLAGIFWISHRNLFRKHIQAPMDMVSQRFEQFQQGDHHSMMRLGRNDEWENVEIVFNKMVLTLNESLLALRESEKRYRDIFTNATEGIFQVQFSGDVIDVNPALAKIFGFDLSGGAAPIKCFETRSIADCYYRTEDLKLWLEELKSQGNVQDFEVQMRRINGELFWAALSGHLVLNSDSTISHIEGTIRDISSSKAAQESIQQLQHYLQNIIDAMPSILIGIDANTEVTLWNRRAEKESALAATEVMGLPIAEACNLFEPEVCQDKILKTLQSGMPNRLLKTESLKKTDNGGSRYFDILIYPLTLASGRGAVIHMDEVTERVQLEEMMVRAEKMQSIGSLAAGLAHEINNPLAVILQNVQVLSRRLSPSLDKNRVVAQELGITIEAIVEYTKLRGCEKMIHSISDAGQRAAKIVENMQSFSRRGASNFLPCDLADLLERTVELAGSDHDMRYNFNFKNIRIIRDYYSIPPVCCESTQIQQVFLNLLKNAAQALYSSTAEPQITLRVFPAEEGSVRVQFEDNGPGIESDVAARIFDPFYTTREVGEGTGLGLSVAYFIITQNHQGSLSVYSRPGEGCRFDLVLPVDHIGVSEISS